MNADGRQNYAIDSRIVRRAANRNTAELDQHAEICHTIASNLLERLELLRQVPKRVLVLGCGFGFELQQLQKRYPRALVVGADLADSRLEVLARARRFWQPARALLCFDPGLVFPFADNCFDLVVANLVLPWVYPADTFASELNRVLAPEGGFFLSTAGPDTLVEVRQAWGAVDEHMHINAMPDMHDLGDLLVGAGVADPVVDVERLALKYSDSAGLLAEMQGLGYACALSGRRRGLYGSNIARRLSDQLALNAAEQDGSVLVSLEIVYAHGWKGQPKQKGSVHTFPLERLARSTQG